MADNKFSIKDRTVRKAESFQVRSQRQTLADDRMKSTGLTASTGKSSLTSLNSESEGKGNYGSSCSSGDSGVEMGASTGVIDSELQLDRMGDVADSVYESVDDFDLDVPSGYNKVTGDTTLRSTSRHDSASVDRKVLGHVTLTESKKNSVSSAHSLDTDLDDLGSLHLSLALTDSTMLEGVGAGTLLSDVLRDCGGINDFSPADFHTKEGKKDAGKVNKSLEFEARMASVAATLDLTKQQQRGKRQIPRPPVSPPPEPSLVHVVSPKKILNQPESATNTSLVTARSCSILSSQETLVRSKPLVISSVTEDSGTASENSDNGSNRAINDGKNKKGLSSFFKNILRKGKGSSENLEAMSAESPPGCIKMERKDSVGVADPVDAAEDFTSCVDQTQFLKLGPHGKLILSPPMSPSQQRNESEQCRLSSMNKVEGENSAKGNLHPDSLTQAPLSESNPTSVASPPVQHKSSRGLSSPKMMLKRATAKFSPPTLRHAIKLQEPEPEAVLPLTSAAAKPNPAPKPVVPPPAKPLMAVALQPSDAGTPVDASGIKEEVTVKDKVSSPGPGVVRRRPTSPKQPVLPMRTSAIAVKADSTDSGSVSMEPRLSQTTSKQSDVSNQSRPEQRESTRRSMPVPPSPPSDRKDKLSTGTPPISPIPDTESLSSPASPTATTFDFPNTEWSGGSSSTIDDELPKFSEKIELPTVAAPGRKGFLGKLGGNRKARTSQSAAVKRAKSITESSTLPRGDKKNKRINVADISGPVLMADVTNSRTVVNRRNTISLGSDPVFALLSSSAAGEGNSVSVASLDKSGFDEFDIPVLSPLGSLENLYESILPKPASSPLFHLYDPPTGPKILCPNIPADGYLEPIPSLSASVVATTASSSTAVSTPASATFTSASTLTLNNLPMSRSPLKTKTSFPKTDRMTSTLPRMSKSSSSSHSPQASASSSGSNSADNSGGSVQDSVQVSSTDVRVSNPPGSASTAIGHPSVPGMGKHFVESDITDQRQVLLASQPIYEEIPNGGNGEAHCIHPEDERIRGKSKLKLKSPGLTVDISPKKLANIEGGMPKPKPLTQTLPPVGDKPKHLVTNPKFKQPQPPEPTVSRPVISPAPPPVSGLPPSPFHTLPKPNSAAVSSMTSSQVMMASIMTSSMTSSMLPPPPPPPDHLPAPPHTASRSASRETVSSESDAQSSCSNLSRPRPAPRQKPRRPYAGSSADQYVSMNRPNTQVCLGEERLRDVFTKLTNITFHALQDIYAQCERILSVDRLNIPNSKVLKWADFDIYGQPLHASGRSVVYNAKLRASDSPCQIMILHSRPATEMCATSHPSLLRPSAVFADTIPFCFLTPDFIKTSQLLQNSVYDSSQAKCFVAVGAFDIVESLESHLALLRESLAQDLNTYLNMILTASLQLLSAMSHCLDQGFSVTETDYNDVFLITRSDLRGKVVAFLPHKRSLEVPQGEAMCNFLERLLTDALPMDDDDDIEDEADVDDDEAEKIISSPKKVVAKLLSMLEPRRVECLGHVRAAVEYLLWGPAQSELPLSPTTPSAAAAAKSSTSWIGSGREQELYVWLEKERVTTVGRLARSMSGLTSGLSLEEFYTLKFLLKSSAACLAESVRRLSR